MLHIANAAFFGFRTPAVTPAEATIRLGTDATLAIIAQLCAQQLSPVPDPDLERASTHAVEVAARAHACDPTSPLLFTGALLHDIGHFVLLARRRRDYEKLLADHPAEGEAWLAAERAAFGVDHASLGARLLELWRFERPLVALVEHHHRPERLDPDLARLARIIDAVQRETDPREPHDPHVEPGVHPDVLEGSAAP